MLAAVTAAIQAPLRLAQQVAQYHGVIAARIVRAVEQRHALLRGALPEPIHQHPKAVRGISFVVDA
jgi:hypothetical protein